MVINVNKLLILVFSLFFTICASAQNRQEGKVYSDVPVTDILLDLAAQHELSVGFKSDYFSSNSRASIDTREASLKSILSELLKPYGVEYKISGSDLTLRKMLRLYGTVVDKKSGETLVNATAYDNDSQTGTYTNEYGFFSANIPIESKSVQFSYIGYKVFEMLLEDVKGKPILVELESDIDLDEVIITQELNRDIKDYIGTSSNILDRDLKTVFGTGGTPDLFQYLYRQSGITTGADGVGGLHVRGGSVDQNLIVYDGVEIYNPSHTLGLFSVFNPVVINHSTVYKSGMPSRYGTKLSSVVDIRMKEGNLRNWNMDMGFSTIATNFMINGPIVKDKTGLIIAFRRSHLDPFIIHFSKKNKVENFNEGAGNHYFYDINLKVNHIIDPKNRIYATYFKSADRLYDNTSSFGTSFDEVYFDDIVSYDLDWGNHMGAVRWNHIYGEKVFSNTILSRNRFKYGSYAISDFYMEDLISGETDFDVSASLFSTAISDIGLDHNIDIYLDGGDKIKMGLGVKKRQYSPGLGSVENSQSRIDTEDVIDDIVDDFNDFSDGSYTSIETAVHGSYGYSLSSNVLLNVGARYTHYRGRNEELDIGFLYHLWMANLQLNWYVNKRWAFILTYDRIAQPLHLISSSDIGFPNELWVPSTDLIKPQVGQQIDITIRHQASENMNLMGSVYYKKQSNLLRFDDIISLPNIGDLVAVGWEEFALVGKGRAFGLNLDFTLQREQFRIDGSYTFTNAQRRNVELNSGQYYPYRFDQPHSIVLNGFYRFKKGLWAYANFKFSSGTTQTLYTTSSNFSPIDISYTPETQVSSSINGIRIPVYHRLDLGIRYNWGKEKGLQDLTFGVQNIYNRQNIYYLYDIEDPDFPENNGRQMRNALPLLPTLSYRVRFGL